jgi:hypothetical protein
VRHRRGALTAAEAVVGWPALVTGPLADGGVVVGALALRGGYQVTPAILERR